MAMMRKPLHNKPDQSAPKPVYLTVDGNHALFSSPHMHNHMMSDERWTADCLIEQCQRVTNLMHRRLSFQLRENTAKRKKLLRNCTNLRTQNNDGRKKLKQTLTGENAIEINKCLLHHKDLSRLFKNLSLPQIVANMDQRSFVMRKDRDRLTFRRNQLEKDLEEALIRLSVVQNRIIYEDRFHIPEEAVIHRMQTQIVKSRRRIRALKHINYTYQRMIKLIEHDEIYYEPILQALEKDVENLHGFIEYTVYIGVPAIKRSAKLEADLKIKEKQARKALQMKIQSIGGYKNLLKKGSSTAPKAKKPELYFNWGKHYERYTKSMLALKYELEDDEKSIAKLQERTLCSRPKFIYPTFKFQKESNASLEKIVALATLRVENKAYKAASAQIKKSSNLENFWKITRLYTEKIAWLKEKVEEQTKIDQDLVAYMKNRSAMMLIFRFALWNFHDLLRHVKGKDCVHFKRIYQSEHLKLPLLKYEMLLMHAAPPPLLEENIHIVMEVVERKLALVMKTYSRLLREFEIDQHKPSALLRYQDEFMKTCETQVMERTSELQEDDGVGDEMAFDETKVMSAIHSRRSMKELSAKIVEEFAKRESD
ncbi:uncharacterized protein LOC119639271 [Glossina fuscipes]|uniref:Uncharacterized protein LOC119639271 n=1 Tax=Glossina fuscipes TaxID=7396 RepID=A0A9C6DUE0_9MUSC|nr:uncharacterized protein LOC119639271 [Glossina fuscipes]KAI9579798.1 hypothetical protein GQX74_000586 [Glossina fuscipes]